MQTGVVDGIHPPLNVRHRDGFPFYLEFSDRSWRHLHELHRSHKRHGLPFSFPGLPTCSLNPGTLRTCRRARRPRRCVRLTCYCGSATCATITFFLNSSTIWGSKRTSVGRFASVILSILSCS